MYHVKAYSVCLLACLLGILLRPMLSAYTDFHRNIGLCNTTCSNQQNRCTQIKRTRACMQLIKHIIEAMPVFCIFLWALLRTYTAACMSYRDVGVGKRKQCESKGSRWSHDAAPQRVGCGEHNGCGGGYLAQTRHIMRNSCNLSSASCDLLFTYMCRFCGMTFADCFLVLTGLFAISGFSAVGCCSFGFSSDFE